MSINWDIHKLEIHSLYLVQGKTLSEVREILKRNRGVDACTRVYKKQLDKWGYRKYNLRKQVNFGNQALGTAVRPIAASPSVFLGSKPQLPQESATTLEWFRPYNSWGDPGYSTPYRNAAAAHFGTGGCSEYKDSEGRSRLHRAALGGLVKQVEELLAEEAYVNARDKRQCQPLHYAAVGGFADIVELLVRSGADIGAKDRNGRTPLHSAAASGAKSQGGLHVLHTMEELLKAQLEPSTTDINGNTALHLVLIHTDAADQIQPSYIKLLLDHGANVNLRNAAGKTPFQIALENLGSRIPPALIGIFLQHGANVGLKDRRGILPFQGYLEKCKSFRYGHPYLKEEVNAVAKTFLVYGASPDTTSQPEESLLCYLLRLGDCLRFNPELALLICEKVDVNLQGMSGNYPLHEVTAYSIKYGPNCIKLFQLLLDRGADPNALNDANVSPLLALFDTKGKGIDVLRMTTALLGKGADPMMRDFNGRLAIYEAAKLYQGEVRHDIVKLILSASFNPQELMELPVGHEDLWWQFFDIALQSSLGGYPGIGLTILRAKEHLLSVTTDRAIIHAAALTVVAETGLYCIAFEERDCSDSTPAKSCTSVDYANDFASLLRVCQDQGIVVDKWYQYLLDFIE
ncbi:MAG: hypothetical protein M1839_001983 [Geoglossum umbratile]|nr:MAG: hypothetical protein M1839_001983 [Geoglossum umbratile]